MLPFKHKRMIYVLLFIFLSIIYSHQSYLDTLVAAWVYDPELGFALRNHFLLEKVFHKGGVLFVLLIGIVILLRMGHHSYLILKNTNNRLVEHQKKLMELIFVFISVLISVLLIKLLKNNTTLPCPWHVEGFGGNRDFQSITTLFSSEYRIGHCFPSGHASAGFSFLSLYFARALYAMPKFSHMLPGLALGSLFAITQELRGAHFLSHDLATILICLFIPCTLSFIIKTYVSRMEGQI